MANWSWGRFRREVPHSFSLRRSKGVGGEEEGFFEATFPFMA